MLRRPDKPIIEFSAISCRNRVTVYVYHCVGNPVTETAGHLEELLSRFKRGDEHALAELFSYHRERLWRTVHFRLDRRLSGRVDPDDVLQEAYLNAAARARHFTDDTPTSFFIWLRMIVNQTLIDLHRLHLGAQMRDAAREVSIHRGSLAHTTSTALAAQLAGGLTSPSGAAVREETARQLEQALQDMDPTDREVLALRHFEELTNGEAAQVLGIKQKAASIRYVRALRRLKKTLAEVPGMTDECRGEP